MEEKQVNKKNLERTILYQVLPLDFPYAINLNISNVCNFRCFYCFHSDKKKIRERHIFEERFMSFDTLKKCVDNINKSGKRLKNINLCGYGEPLLNKDFCKMVTYIKQQQITDCVETITNASVLTKQYCDEIIASGLDKIRISLQGLSAESYSDVTGNKISFEQLYDNIKYLCKNKKNLYVYVKIMDVMLSNENERERFLELFQDVADETYVESLMPLSDLDYSKAESDFSTTLYGEKLKTENVCTQPFYSCTVDWDGTVFPCCMVPVPKKFGNLLEIDFEEIWNGKEYNSFLISLLNRKAYEKNLACSKCERYKYVMLERDSLVGKENELIARYLEKIT